MRVSVSPNGVCPSGGTQGDRVPGLTASDTLTDVVWATPLHVLAMTDGQPQYVSVYTIDLPQPLWVMPSRKLLITSLMKGFRQTGISHHISKDSRRIKAIKSSLQLEGRSKHGGLQCFQATTAVHKDSLCTLRMSASHFSMLSICC